MVPILFGEDEDILYEMIECDCVTTLSNTGLMMDSLDIILHAYESPNDCNFWIDQCNDHLPVSSDLFRSLVEKHFSIFTFSDFCNVDMSVSEKETFLSFQNDLMLHYKQLDMDKVKNVYFKLEFWWHCLEDEVKPKTQPILHW